VTEEIAKLPTDNFNSLFQGRKKKNWSDHKKLRLSSTDPCNSEDPFHAREQKIKGSCYHNFVKSDSKARPTRKQRQRSENTQETNLKTSYVQELMLISANQQFSDNQHIPDSPEREKLLRI
jgi:hypothetical protein